MDFALFHPWMMFWLIVLALPVVNNVVCTPFRMWNRWLRSRNIREQGWPPEHLDADGDALKVERR